MNEVIIDIPLQATMPEAVEIFKSQLPLLNLSVNEVEGDSPTVKLRIAHITKDESVTEKD